jgi:hypothetical protein
VTNPFIGSCRLCQQVGEPKISHVQPAGVFKKLRDPNSKNPNPAQLSKKGMVQTSRQPTARLLCTDCEQRFNREGEKWVLGNCYHGGIFPLRDMLLRGTQERVSIGLACWASSVPEIQINQLVYFATSMFWRASIYRVPFEDEENNVNLGTRYEEPSRKYLLGVSDFPRDAAIMVTVSPAPKESAAVWSPSGDKFKGDRYGGVPFWAWRCSVPGVVFDLFIGKMLPEVFHKMSLLRSTRNYIFMTEKVDERIADAMMMLGVEARRSNRSMH